MFKNCSSLTSLDLSTFITTGLGNSMYGINGGTVEMFSGCTNLTDIDMRNATFLSFTHYVNMFTNITNGINIVVKDVTAQTWITSRLTEAGKTGTVVIA